MGGSGVFPSVKQFLFTSRRYEKKVSDGARKGLRSVTPGGGKSVHFPC